MRKLSKRTLPPNPRIVLVLNDLRVIVHNTSTKATFAAHE